MKRTILLISFLTVGFYSQAQISITNATLQYFTNDLVTPVDGTLEVVNSNQFSVDINIYRTIELLAHSNSLNTDHDESFCFGQYCYVPGTDTSLFLTPINANTTEGSFVAHVDPKGFGGTDRLHYKIFDINHPADSAAVTFEFVFSATGIDEHKNSAFLNFNNEVNSLAVLNYHLPVASPNSRIDIYNLLGTKLRTIALHDQLGTKILSTSDMADGVYLLSLVTNNVVSHTYKMVVRHN